MFQPSPFPRSRSHSLLIRVCALCLMGMALGQAQDEAANPAVSPKAPSPPDSAQRDGQIWGALFFASEEADENQDTAKTTKKAEPHPISGRLGKVFPQSSFTLIGEHTQQIFSEYESWVVPSRNVFLKIDSKGPTEDGKGVNLHLQLWHDKSVLVKTDAVLRDHPIFIGGPKWGKGQLIMVVALK